MTNKNKNYLESVLLDFVNQVVPTIYLFVVFFNYNEKNQWFFTLKPGWLVLFLTGLFVFGEVSWTFQEYILEESKSSLENHLKWFCVSLVLVCALFLTGIKIYLTSCITLPGYLLVSLAKYFLLIGLVNELGKICFGKFIFLIIISNEYFLKLLLTPVSATYVAVIITIFLF